MKVCLVSTYPPQRCGIATYAQALASGLASVPDLDLAVLCEHGGLDGMDGAVRSSPVFHRSHDWESELLLAVRAQKPDLVHVQHSPDIFGVDRRLPRLLDSLREEGVRSVVTLHTVYSRWTGLLERKPLVPEFHRRLAAAADRILVHQVKGMADALLAQGVEESKVAVLPHGTGNSRSVDSKARIDARQEFGLPEEGPVLLYFGFIHVQKNLHTPLLALALLRKRMPGLRLLIAGSVQYPTWYNRAYLAAVDGLVTRLGLSDRVVSVRRYIQSSEIESLYAASDLVILPYNQGYGSASGMVHNALAAGVPVLCSTSPKFHEVAESLGPDLVVSTHNPRAWARRIEELLASPTRVEELRGRIQEHSQNTAWSIVADRHRELYASCLNPSNHF